MVLKRNKYFIQSFIRLKSIFFEKFLLDDRKMNEKFDAIMAHEDILKTIARGCSKYRVENFVMMHLKAEEHSIWKNSIQTIIHDVSNMMTDDEFNAQFEKI